MAPRGTPEPRPRGAGRPLRLGLLALLCGCGDLAGADWHTAPRPLGAPQAPTLLDAGAPTGDAAPGDGHPVAPPCATDDDCDDQEPCNGAERCVARACGAGVAPGDGASCDVDGDPGAAGVCLGERCAPTGCGDGAAEARDWYADCDRDGYAGAGALRVTTCVPPDPGRAPCPGASGGWVALAPSAARHTDCHDGDARVHPAQTVPQREPMDGSATDLAFDYDCDGEEEPLFDLALGRCELRAFGVCDTHPGWLGEAPRCGESALTLEQCVWVVWPGGEDGCVQLPSTTLRVQRCL